MPEGKAARIQAKVGGLHCSFCTTTLERALGRRPGVQSVNISLAHEEALVTYDPALIEPAAIVDTIRDLGYTVRDPGKVRSFEEEEAELRREGQRFLLAAGASAVTLAAMTAGWLGRPPPAGPWILLGLALDVVLVLGWPILRMAVASVRRGILNQHVLLEFGAWAGLVGGFLGLFVSAAFPAADFLAVAVFITTYHLLSGWVSLLVRTRASQSVRRLMALQPDTARVVRAGRETEVPIDDVVVGDLVRIRPGERVPVDGRVIDGRSPVAEALVSGEPIPVTKRPGDEVIGGSMNGSGTLLVEVIRVGESTFLAQVARTVQEARALKPGIIVLVDRILKVFVPGVLAISGLAFMGWLFAPVVIGSQPDPQRAVFAALAVLVMGYPCALGMATPLAMIRGGGMAAERGVLIRSAAAFQSFGEIGRIVFDKTGTLTAGEPQLLDARTAPDVDVPELLRVAASVEAHSQHPLGRAVVEGARRWAIELEPVADFTAVEGRGVEGRLGTRRVRVGRLDWAIDGPPPDWAATASAGLEARGRTVVAVAAESKLLGLLGIADEIKPDAASAVEALRWRGMRPLLLTGDAETTARAVAAEVGIDEIAARVLPADKAARIRALQAAGERVAMVGDGINDAPALMQADIGIAIGAGADIAIEAADIVLVGERLMAIADAYDVAVTSYRKTRQNLALAFAFNGVGVPLAAMGLLDPIWAMAAMVASVTTVLANSFGGRLLRPVGRLPARPATEPAG